MAKESIQLYVCPNCREIGDPHDDNVIIHEVWCTGYVKPVLVTFIPARDAE